ncbi:MAG: 3-oxoacyl-[acyl-carrier-protein] reductase FabG [Calditrichaeota bacterium]|nr:3-oxoacyl-[acyl-carrier-protein] reductase FabG [Calditrichota bacterium]
MAEQAYDWKLDGGGERVALISGGTRGLGRAFSEALLAHNWRVAAFARRGSEFVERAESDPSLRDRFLARRLDVRDSKAVHGFVYDISRRWGRIDLLVNNAGLSRPAPIALAGDDYIERHLDTNLGAAMRLTRMVVQVMLPQRRGRIINVTSVVGIRGYSGMAAYSAAKAGVDAITRCLAKELGSAGITVNSLAPGYVPTEMTEKMPDDVVRWNLEHTPLGRLGSVEDYVAPFLFLASGAAGFVNGQTLVVDGGMTA